MCGENESGTGTSCVREPSKCLQTLLLAPLTKDASVPLIKEVLSDCTQCRQRDAAATLLSLAEPTVDEVKVKISESSI